MSPISPKLLRSQLYICVFLDSDDLAQSVRRHLSDDRHFVTVITSSEEFFTFIEQEKQRLDCLILQAGQSLPHLANWLHGHATVLPVLIVGDSSNARDNSSSVSSPAVNEANHADQGLQLVELMFIYHTAEVWVSPDQFDQLAKYIDRAITQFINLSPVCRLTNSATDLATDLTAQNFLLLQQRRLAEKLKERLGYLGVYYKRNPQNFFRHLPPDEKQELLGRLKADYRDIVLGYFSNDETLNEQIDAFVNTIFFTDVAVSQIVEIHMDLMDEFSKQLKLEGRGEEVLLDYRLTLIDTLAHLCEMYRRSIPRESYSVGTGNKEQGTENKL